MLPAQVPVAMSYAPAQAQWPTYPGRLSISDTRRATIGAVAESERATDTIALVSFLRTSVLLLWLAGCAIPWLWGPVLPIGPAADTDRYRRVRDVRAQLMRSRTQRICRVHSAVAASDVARLVIAQ